MNDERVQQLYQAGHHQEAWWAYTASTARGDAPWKVYLWGAMAAHAMGRMHSALHALEQGMGIVSGEGLGTLRFAHAAILIQVGRLDASAEAFWRWIADLTAYPSLESSHLGVAYYHLGLISRQQERFAESIQHYRTACEHLRRHNQRGYLSLTLHNMAWAACLLGDEATAMDALDEAMPLCDTPESQWHQQIGRAFWLAVAHRGDPRMAMTLCEEIIDYKGGDLPRTVRSHAYWLAGRVAMELNLGDTARVMAEQALVAAVGIDAGQCVADAYRLLAEVDRRFSVADTSGLC